VHAAACRFRTFHLPQLGAVLAGGRRRGSGLGGALRGVLACADARVALRLLQRLLARRLALQHLRMRMRTRPTSGTTLSSTHQALSAPRLALQHLRSAPQQWVHAEPFPPIHICSLSNMPIMQ
jgi:hypothetical protein